MRSSPLLDLWPVWLRLFVVGALGFFLGWADALSVFSDVLSSL